MVSLSSPATPTNDKPLHNNTNLANLLGGQVPGLPTTQRVMNLELLDPFGRQVPDRIDATIDLPAALHFRSHDGHEETKKGNMVTEGTDWKSAFHVAFNRRGTYVAVGYGSGTVAVHDVLSRTLSALYRNEDEAASPSEPGLGISNVSWSRRSRTLLAGSIGDSRVHLFDTSHPYGPEEGSRQEIQGEYQKEEFQGNQARITPTTTTH